MFHDPTWAKLLYEYGILGFVSFVALTLLVLRTMTRRWREADRV